MALYDQHWAVTMFSFTNEMMAARATPDELLARVGAEALGRAIEVDAAQHFTSFPRIDAVEMDAFRATVDAQAMSPTLLGIYLDFRLDAGRPRTEDEALDFLTAQCRAAASMGFMGVRVGLGAIPPGVTQRLLPELEALELRLLEEVQGGVRPTSPLLDARREWRARLDTDRLGFVLDTSVAMAGLPATWTATMRSRGVPSNVLIEVERVWRSGRADAFTAVQALTAEAGIPAGLSRQIAAICHRFGSGLISDWLDFIGEASVVHLKYWDLDDEEQQLTALRSIRSALETSGYSGFVCSEWGGHDWIESSDASGYELTRRHRALFEEVGQALTG